jgi:hypothetical protein
MTVKAQIIGQGDNRYAQIHTRDEHTGLKVYTQPLIEGIAAGRPYLNATYGAAMNQNGLFSGNPLIVHDGTDTLVADSGTTDGATTSFKLIESGQNFDTTVFVGHTVHNTVTDQYALVTVVDSDTLLTLDTDIMETGQTYNIGETWTGSQIAGNKVTFNSTDQDNGGTKSVKVDNPSLNDVWQFAKVTDQALSSYLGITFDIYVDSDWGVLDSVILYGWDVSGAAQVGNSIDIKEYFNEFDFDVWHSVTIPLTDMGLEVATITALRMQMAAVGAGKNPKFYIDNLQIEELGSPITYSVIPDAGTKFHVSKIVFQLADTGTGGTAYAYDQIGAISRLAVGITLTTTSGGETIFSATFRQLSDLLLPGGVVENHIDDGTDTYISIGVNLNESAPVVLDSRENDEFTITISDNLSGLLLFNAFARGFVETIA